MSTPSFPTSSAHEVTESMGAGPHTGPPGSVRSTCSVDLLSERSAGPEPRFPHCPADEGKRSTKWTGNLGSQRRTGSIHKLQPPSRLPARRRLVADHFVVQRVAL